MGDGVRFEGVRERITGDSMSSDRECLCCPESEILQNFHGSNGCFVSTELFKNIVLCEGALLYSQFLFSRGRSSGDSRGKESEQAIVTTTKQFRFLAYSAFINLVLTSAQNRRVRYVLPSCAVNSIRNVFPSPDGIYTGHVVCNSTETMNFP